MINTQDVLGTCISGDFPEKYHASFAVRSELRASPGELK